MHGPEHDAAPRMPRGAGFGEGTSSASIVLGAVVALGLLSTGAVGPGERAVLHGLLAVGLVVLSWDRRGLSPHGAGLWRAAAPVLVAVGLGLLPLPRAVLGVLSPGRVAAHPGQGGLLTPTLAPFGTVETVAGLVATLTVAWLAATAGRRWRDPVGAVAASTAGLALFGAAHVATGAERLLGLVAVREPFGPFWAPLINPNHFGTLLVLGLPALGDVASDRARPTGTRGAAAAIALGIVVFPAVSASAGLWVALSAQAAVAGWWWGQRHGRRGLVLAAFGVGALLALGGLWAVVSTQPEWWRLSGEPRLRQWWDTAAILADHPWLGVGAGAYGEAYPPYRTVPTFARFLHAHGDPQQWVAETGLVGLALLGVALARLPRGVTRHPLALGLVGAAAHGVVDFPWRVPGVMLTVAAVYGLWLGHRPRRPPGGPGPRAGGAALRWGAVAHGVAALALLGAAQVDREASRLQDDPSAPAPWIARLAPHHPAYLLARHATAAPSERGAWEAALETHHGHDAQVWRELARRDLSEGSVQAALPRLRRAVVRDPNDFRTHYLLARTLHDQGVGLEAVEHLAEALRHWPRASAGGQEVFDVAWAWLPLGDWWLEALADAPAHWSVRLAWTAFADGDATVALAAAEQAGRLRPAAHARMPVAARALARLGRGEEARSYVDAWLAEDPDHPFAWVARAQVLEELGVADTDPAWLEAWIQAAFHGADRGAIRRGLAQARGRASDRADQEDLAAALALVDAVLEGDTACAPQADQLIQRARARGIRLQGHDPCTAAGRRRD